MCDPLTQPETLLCTQCQVSYEFFKEGTALKFKDCDLDRHLAGTVLANISPLPTAVSEPSLP